MVDALDLVLIHQLLGEYGHAIDTADWERFAALFVPDAVLDYTAVRAPACASGSTKSSTTSTAPTIRRRIM